MDDSFYVPLAGAFISVELAGAISAFILLGTRFVNPFVLSGHVIDERVDVHCHAVYKVLSVAMAKLRCCTFR